NDANTNRAQTRGEPLGTLTAGGRAFSKDIALSGDGVHHVRAFQTDVAGNVSAVSTALDITIDTAAATPAGRDLPAADDGGASNSDDRASHNTALTSSIEVETAAAIRP